MAFASRPRRRHGNITRKHACSLHARHRHALRTCPEINGSTKKHTEIDRISSATGVHALSTLAFGGRPFH
eukprot:3515292-Pyramimonas_sp.AAC.1